MTNEEIIAIFGSKPDQKTIEFLENLGCPVDLRIGYPDGTEMRVKEIEFWDDVQKIVERVS